MRREEEKEVQGDESVSHESKRKEIERGKRKGDVRSKRVGLGR